MPAKKVSAKKKPLPAPRLPVLEESKLKPDQRALLDSLREGPRGNAVQIRGPFAVILHAPAYGELAQKLGAHVRFSKLVPHRLTELAILVTAHLWRSEYEWHMHAVHAEKAGISPKIINDLRMGRNPKGLTKHERAIYDFVKELHKTKRVSDRNYKRVHEIVGDAGMVEFVGMCGYYVLVAMTLNVFRMPPPDGKPLAFPGK
jgi:4-carboxymuconolactone decarboxylase